MNQSKSKHWIAIRRERGEINGANLEEDCCRGSTKMRQNMERGSEVSGQQSQMEMLRK